MQTSSGMLILLWMRLTAGLIVQHPRRDARHLPEADLRGLSLALLKGATGLWNLNDTRRKT